MASANEREARRRKVAELGKTGLKPGEIAKKISITPQLAGRDLSWVRKNNPEWLENKQNETKALEDKDNVNDDQQSVDSPASISKPIESEPITEETPAVRPKLDGEQLLAPPVPPVQGTIDRKPVDYTMDTMLGIDGNVDDRPIDEIWNDRSEPAKYGQRERFMDMSDDEKWNYMQHKVTTDFILIACVAIVIILILSILYAMR